jgi:hypothetical protein
VKNRLELAGMRKDVAFAIEHFPMTERRACKRVGLSRSSYRYEPTNHQLGAHVYGTVGNFRIVLLCPGDRIPGPLLMAKIVAI